MPHISLLRYGLFLALAFASHPIRAQWQILPTPTTADLRGIHALPNGIAWASGTEGTVLRTTDEGKTWQRCPTPPAAEKLDFRGIQAFDAQTAIVMSSGKGDLSRLYKTTDACQTWTLLFTNADPEGFWDAIQFTSRDHGFLVGDPIVKPGDPKPRIFLEETSDSGLHWKDWHDHAWGPFGPEAGTTIFAASNSSIIAGTDDVRIATGGDHPGFIDVSRHFPGICNCVPMPTEEELKAPFAVYKSVPFSQGNTAGIFAMASAGTDTMLVGGDYKKPNEAVKNALFLHLGFPIEPQTPPHGYRSSVAYDSTTKTWITVGPNGTDISTDDGRNWSPLKPTPTDPPDADRNWNALSLPYVVGPHGRIGKLSANALTPVKP